MGLVRSAHGGCLFLDEVGDLPLQAQVKLLRVIESDRVQPLGEGRSHQVDVRFVAATHRDLPARVREGAFRADLYQRIAGVVIHLLPLRERPEDIAVIGEHFVDGALRGESFERDRLLAFLHGAEARKRAWPGNVRELQNVLRNLLLGLEVEGIGAAEQPLPGEAVPPRIARGDAPLEEVELWYARRALDRADGNLTQAARVLGIDRTTLARRLERA
jgi:DNA-binding NtrC family response regulator